MEAENIVIYNEFSFQHEIGIFLRKELKGYRIQLVKSNKWCKFISTHVR